MSILTAYRNVGQACRVPETMQALVMDGTGYGHVAVREIPVPRPGPNQLLARVDAAGVCASLLKIIAQGQDHTYFNGWDPSRFPVTLGDEGSVTIVVVGRSLQGRYRAGERYAIQPAVAHPPINYRERFRNQGVGMDKLGVGYTLGGNLAQYILILEEVIAADCLIPLPGTGVPYFAASMAEPISCVVSSQERHVHIGQESPQAPRRAELGLLRGGVTVIVGAGAMGKIHAELALRYRPAHLIVNDLMPARLDWVATRLGPKAAAAGVKLHTAGAQDVEKVIREVSGGRGADDIILAVGVRPVQQKALGWLGRGGVANLFGGLKKGEHILELDAIRVHYEDIKVVGSSGGVPRDMVTTLEIIQSGQIDPGQHVGFIGSLDQAVDAIHAIEEVRTEGKTILYPHVRTTALFPGEGWDGAKENAFLEQGLLRS